MKITSVLKTLATVFAVAITQLGSPAQAKETLPGVAEQPATYFYTGKPYDGDLGSYTFNARNYSPEINRWTSVDPSGFPDGANGQRYSPVPTNGLDPLGLQSYSYNYSWTGYYRVSGSTSNLSIVANVSASVVALATTGPTSLVFSAIATAAGAVGGVPTNWTSARTPSVTSGWLGENGAPPSGGTYVGFSLGQVPIEISTSESVYFPTSDTSGTNFFSPYDQGNLAEILNGGHTPSPEEWAEYAPSGLAYPGMQNSYSIPLASVRFAVNFNLEVE